MFITQWDSTKVASAPTVKMVCGNCGNETEHELHEFPVGLSIGIPFFRKPLLSAHKYYYVCPTCHNASKEITKEQVRALKQ